MSAFKKLKGLVTLESFAISCCFSISFTSDFGTNPELYWTDTFAYICWLKPRNRVPLSYLSPCPADWNVALHVVQHEAYPETHEFQRRCEHNPARVVDPHIDRKIPNCTVTVKLGNPAAGSKAAQHLHVWSSLQLPTWCQSNPNISKYWGKKSTSSTARSQQEKFQCFQEHNQILGYKSGPKPGPGVFTWIHPVCCWNCLHLGMKNAGATSINQYGLQYQTLLDWHVFSLNLFGSIQQTCTYLKIMFLFCLGRLKGWVSPQPKRYCPATRRMVSVASWFQLMGSYHLSFHQFHSIFSTTKNVAKIWWSG